MTDKYIITKEHLQKFFSAWMNSTKNVYELHQIHGTILNNPYNPQLERKKILDEVIVLLDKLYESKYDPRPCNRTDNGGLYNDGELDLILEIQDMIKHIQNEGK